MKKLFILIVLVVATAPSYATTLKQGRIACMSEELLDDAFKAVVAKDDRGFKYAMSHGCFLAKPEIQISILNVGWTGTVKVRAYIKNTSVVLWAPSSSIQR